MAENQDELYPIALSDPVLAPLAVLLNLRLILSLMFCQQT